MASDYEITQEDRARDALIDRLNATQAEATRWKETALTIQRNTEASAAAHAREEWLRGHTEGVEDAGKALDAMSARLAEAERLLRGVEWSAWRSKDGAACCIQCWELKPTHAPNCTLARWLEGGGR